MQNQNLPLLSTHRENYVVPKGEEREVHYKIERVLFDPTDGVTRVSHPDLVKTNVKMFDDVKRNLELQGYTVEILYHPDGKYSNVVIPGDARAEIAQRDDEIAALRAEIARMKADVASEMPEVNEEKPVEETEAKAETAPVKKGGRAKKSE